MFSSVTTYLLSRLSELGVRHVFGVPGDYNLTMLDFVEQYDGIRWIGTANELNAAYAADGYARINGAGALITTYGVGELSAINAVAGAYAESVPLVHIVGAPSTEIQLAGAFVHHTLGGDFGRFMRIAAEVTVAQTQLSSITAQEEIDRVLAAMLTYRKPVHIVVPADVAGAMIAAPRERLDPMAGVEVDALNLYAFSRRARSMLEGARNIAVIAGHLVDRFGVRAALAQLLSAWNVRAAVLSTSKGVVDETHPNFAGLYAGELSDEYTRRVIEEADVIVTAGVVLTDGTTGGFTHRLAPPRRIDVGAHKANIAGTIYENVPIAESLWAVTEIVKHHAA